MTVNNEAITKALTEAQSVDEMVAAFADQGIDITAEELKQVLKDVLAMNTARNIVVGAVKAVGQAFVNFVKTTFGF